MGENLVAFLEVQKVVMSQFAKQNKKEQSSLMVLNRLLVFFFSLDARKKKKEIIREGDGENFPKKGDRLKMHYKYVTMPTKNIDVFSSSSFCLFVWER